VTQQSDARAAGYERLTAKADRATFEREQAALAEFQAKQRRVANKQDAARTRARCKLAPAAS
jgi:hypothetical protein